MAPVVPLKAAVKLRIAFEGGILVHKRAIRNTWTTHATQRQVVVRFVSFGRVVIDIERRKSLAQYACKFGDVFVERRHGIEPAYRHLARAVVIEIVESK